MITLRRLTIGYAIAAAWLCGWLTATFGWFPAMFASVIAGAPAIVAWRMARRKQPVALKGSIYLAMLTLACVGATGFVIGKWFDAGIDALVVFERECDEFRRRIDELPEYAAVEVTYTRRKGGLVHLEGQVASKESHDRLIDMLERTVRNAGHFDRVDYPGKPQVEASAETRER